MSCTANARAGAASGSVNSVSKTGLFLATSAKLPCGHHLEVEFFLPDGTYAKALGEVRRIASGPRGEAGLGIRFLRINSEALTAIEQLGQAADRIDR